MKKGKKLTNTFRFQNFAERIGSINIDIHRNTSIISAHEIPEDDKDTFFRETLEKWNELNCSIDFTKLYRKLRPKVQSFNQLIFHKNEIVEILMECLNKEESFAFEPSLELLSQLAKDLLEDFYVYFEQIFPILLKFLKTQDTVLIEQTFICFAHIFKYIWQCMVQNMTNVFSLFNVLLSSKQKLHIRVFAAEAFAFLIRKSKNKEKTIVFLLEQIDEELAEGIGHLLFQSIKGITGRLSLSAEEFLQMTLKAASMAFNDKVFTTLQTMWIAALKHTKKEHSSELFSVLLQHIKTCIISRSHWDVLNCFLKLLECCIAFKSGYLVADQNAILQVLSKNISVLCSTAEKKESLQQTIATFINIQHCELTDEEISAFLNLYISQNDLDLLDKIEFFRMLLQWDKFDEILKPIILSQFTGYLLTKKNNEVKTQKTMIFRFLTDVVYKEGCHSLCQPFRNTNFHNIALEFQIPKNSQATFDSVFIKELSVKTLNQKTEWFWIVVKVLTNSEISEPKKVFSCLGLILKKTLEPENLENLTPFYLFTLSHAIQCYLMFSSRSEQGPNLHLPVALMIGLLKKYPTNESALKCFEFYICLMRKANNEISKGDVETVCNHIKGNLSSPCKMKRLFTLLILQHLTSCMKLHGRDEQALADCISAERIDANLDTHRNKMMYLQKLTIMEPGQFSKQCSEFILRFLIGNLFANFSIIWEPITKVIVSHASNENVVFWDIWKDMLQTAAELCRKLGDVKEDDEQMEVLPEKQNSAVKYFNTLTVYEKEQRPDYFNFRNLLWTAMTHFPRIVEKNSKDVVPIFLEYLEKEYTLNDELLARTQDLTKTITKRDSKNSISSHGRQRIKCLCAHLKVFTFFKNPKSLSKEKKLYQCYIDFLASKENDIQVLAVGCLQTYKFPYLKPYSESFEKLMDDALFREELVKYSSENTEASIYKEDHREKLMPILIRLLYGKLQRRSGMGMSGKSNHSVRRNVIMHFLANCGAEDIKTFIQLMLEPLKAFEDYNITSSDCVVDVTSVVPLQRQAGYCNMFSSVTTRLRTMMVPYLPMLLSTLLKVIWASSWCLNKKQDEITAYVGRVKDLQRNGVFKLIEIFNTMPHIELNDHIGEIFQAVIWPKLTMLPFDSCQNMTPLSHLIVCWSSHSRFFPLFAIEDEAGNSLLSCFYRILEQNVVGGDVEKQIMTLSLSLLTRADHEYDGSNGVAVAGHQRFESNESIGVQLIRPYVHKLLHYLYKKLHTKTDKMKLKTKQKIGNIIPIIQLDVLANISEFVTDRDQCEKIVMILFPLLRCVTTQQIQTHIITTINNLLPYVTNVCDHLHLMPALFANFHARKPRALLCELYVQMTATDTALSSIARYLSATNSWDSQHLDDPDYEKRMSAYRDVTNEIKAKKWTLDELSAVLHNSFFFIGTTDDMSIRDAASGVIETVIKYMVDEERFEKAVFTTMLPSIKHGFKSKNQIIRYEFVQLLALLVKTFEHDGCADLRLLCSDDVETDFYENIRHVQSHRRTRALQLLNRTCEEKKLSANNLFSLFLPLISHAIFDNLSQTKDHNLLSETITVMGNIVSCLPWNKYFMVLKNYLKVLQKDKRNQKTIIRVVVSMLNNFPFDLSTVNPACAQPELEKKRSKSKQLKNQTKAPNKNEEKQSNEKEATNRTKDQSEPTNQDKEEEKHQKKVQLESTNQDEESDDEDDDDDDKDDNLMELEAKEKENNEKNLERIYISLTTKLLPRLKRFFLRKSSSDSFHKLSRSHEDDEEEIMKAPVALAIIKMLQHLPMETLTSNLSGLILRVSQALKSQARDVREVARDTLKKILLSLGPRFLHLLIKDMKSVLQRGYQLHVLGFTIHSMLESAKDQMKSGDIDSSVYLLMEIITEELFGTVGEEKDVQKIAVKMHEAKSKKSNELLEIIGRYITSGTVNQLIQPFQEVLGTHHDHKTNKTVEEALRRIGMGLQSNKDISGEDLLIFIHGIVSNTMTRITAKNSEQKTEKVGESSDDIYIIPEQPIRGGKKPGMSKQTNQHILVEFGLQLLHTGLKRQKYGPKNMEHIRMLDPLVPVTLKSMSSGHGKIVTLTMRCVSLMVKFPLPSLKRDMPQLAKTLFKAIKKYGRVGAGQGENFEMIFSAFKAMTVIIRDYKLSVTNKQLQVLLSYVEEDIHDSTRQSTALPLLKGILSRKLIVPAIHEIMRKVSELSVRDSDEVIRVQCRQLVMIYMLDYPLGKNLTKLLDFYLLQLSYDEETGRTSVLELFASIFRGFPVATLVNYSGYFFIPLVMMLVNDDSALCRKMAAAAVKLLLTKTDGETRNELFEIVMTWNGHKKALLRQVSMQLIGMFVEVAAEEMETKLDVILPAISNILKQGISALEDEDDEDEDSEDESCNVNTAIKERGKQNKGDLRVIDKLLYNSLTCLGKLFAKSNMILLNEKHASEVNIFLSMMTELLLHSHSWVRFASSQLFGLYFAATPASTHGGKSYFHGNTEEKVKDLCYVFYEQLKDDHLSQEIAEQATKNLIYLSKIVKQLDPNLDSNSNNHSNGDLERDDGNEATNHDEESANEVKKITMKTLIMKMCRLATYEAKNAPKESVKRTSVFRWIAALCMELTSEQLLPYLSLILHPINRNIVTNKDEDGDLYKLAQEVMELIRSVIDKQTFAEAFSSLQKKVSEKREVRKRKLAIEAVADPASFALRKKKINLAKRQQKKRKLYEQKPILKFKKIRSKPED